MKGRTLADILKEKGIAKTDFVSQLKRAQIASVVSNKKYTSWKEAVDTLPTFTLPQLSPGETASIRIDILPEYCSYPISKRNAIQVQVEGLEMFCGITYRVHYRVGPDEANFVCLQSLSDSKVLCPICELAARAERKGDANTAKQWSSRYRSLLQVVSPDTPDRVFLFDFSFPSFYSKLLTAFSNLRFDDMPLSHLQNGVLPVEFQVVAEVNYIYVNDPSDITFITEYEPTYPADLVLQTRDVADILRLVPPKWLLSYARGEMDLSELLSSVRELEQQGTQAVLDEILRQSAAALQKKHQVEVIPKAEHSSQTANNSGSVEQNEKKLETNSIEEHYSSGGVSAADSSDTTDSITDELSDTFSAQEALSKEDEKSRRKRIAASKMHEHIDTLGIDDALLLDESIEQQEPSDDTGSSFDPGDSLDVDDSDIDILEDLDNLDNLDDILDTSDLDDLDDIDNFNN